MVSTRRTKRPSFGDLPTDLEAAHRPKRKRTTVGQSNDTQSDDDRAQSQTSEPLESPPSPPADHIDSDSNVDEDDGADFAAANADEDEDFDFTADHEDTERPTHGEHDADLSDEDEDASGTLTAFGSALSSLLSTDAPAADPILAASSAPLSVPVDRELAEARAARLQKRARAEWREKDHVAAAANEREKRLSKLATRGVVQLFNAVQKQRAEARRAEALRIAKVKSTEATTARETKATALPLLQTAATHPSLPSLSTAAAVSSNPQWSALREDFLLGSKLTDWDRQVESDDDLAEHEAELDE